MMRGALDRSLQGRWSQWRGLIAELHDRLEEARPSCALFVSFLCHFVSFCFICMSYSSVCHILGS